ncbi:DUF2514 family protein [Edwardsiella piscicida]|uniref:DUF2514 family protein n=1 Tax=Edwardsiella piscicida TaxID=1263550 RepID=UPI00247A9E0E|nr:DUF2514 family protein [Edwardsiella piscicida]WGS75564.1 DUF2514 family protein [Edwardsiella piscicida]WGS78953.1 DUF2514 family protein [Edwardsiella piscicida]
MSFLELIKRYWLIPAFAIAILSAAWCSYDAGYQKADLAWQARWNQAQAENEHALALLQAKNRDLEQRGQNAVAKIAAQTSQQLAGAKADASAARSDADSLRKQVADYASRLRKSSASCNAGTSGASAPGSDPRVLAELYSLADQAAERMAEEARKSRIRGLACERAYDEVRLTRQ